MDRRDFIKAAAGTFFIASGERVFGAGAASNRVRLAIVGCHEKGRGFAVMKSAMKVPGVEIACVCDVDRRAREFAAAYVLKETGFRPKAEKDFRKVLEEPEIDGIVSATPDHFHAWSAVMAMRAGKAVYVEKPCCFCPAEGQVLMRMAELPAPRVMIDAPGEKRVFEPETPTIAFPFSSDCPGLANRVVYEARLLPMEPDFIPVRGRPVVSYRYLPYGDYRVEVRARLPFGKWGPVEARRFSVRPKPSENPWVQGVAVLLLLLLVGSTVRYVIVLRVRWRIERMRRFELLAAERGRISRDIHEDVGARMTRISLLLVLTVYEDAEKIFQALSAGANGYLLKRVSPDRLLAAVRELKAGGSPMSGSVARKVVQSFQRMGVSRHEEENLSPRESEILSLLVDGLIYKEISEKTGIAYETVRTYIRRIYEKLHVRTRSEAIARHLGR